jgi:hypothetical protein
LIPAGVLASQAGVARSTTENADENARTPDVALRAGMRSRLVNHREGSPSRTALRAQDVARSVAARAASRAPKRARARRAVSLRERAANARMRSRGAL